MDHGEKLKKLLNCPARHTQLRKQMKQQMEHEGTVKNPFNCPACREREKSNKWSNIWNGKDYEEIVELPGAATSNKESNKWNAKAKWKIVELPGPATSNEESNK